VTDENGFERDTTQVRCVEVDFPGKYQGMTRLLRRQTASGPIAWMGSLMQDAQDASGLLFRRNRYYDPASGRFTQEDPIGLAGGLNGYGFAGGDPVNYADPLGLCPDHLYDKARQSCPGGLTSEMFYEAEAAIATLADAELRGALSNMLASGDIRLVGRVWNGEPAGSPRGHIQVTESFFTGIGSNGKTLGGYQTTGERGWVLGHEYGHQVQRRTRRLTSIPMTLSTDIGDYFDARGGALFDDWQRDANSYACHRTTAPTRGAWEPKCNPPYPP
jgi:RHS repeat-associated protein